MINIRSHIAPFKFNVNKRHYNIDFEYRVLGIDDESGAGKSLFVQDIVNKQNLVIKGKDNKTTFKVFAFNAHTQGELIVEYILKNELKNKLIIIDDLEYFNPHILLEGIQRTKELNTQWLLIGHGNFCGITGFDAIRRIKTVKNGNYTEISLKY